MKWLRAGPTVGNVAVADRGRVVLGWGGFVLPAVRMSGGCVHPVIEWTPSAEFRWVSGPEPEPDRATLSEWECGGPGTAVRIVGFVHVGTPGAGVDRLKAVAGYGPGALIVRSVARVGAWTMAEADLAGLSVVEVDRGGGRMALAGREGPVASARRSVATRLREEQLFEWALRVGHKPQNLPVTERSLVS